MRKENASNDARSRREPPVDSTLSFLRLLWSLDHSLRRMSKRMESSLGLTGPQRLVIRAVGQFPGTSAGRVAEFLQVHPSTLTGVLKRLHTRGLIGRRALPRDRRQTVLTLTAKGRGVDASTADTIESVVRRIMGEVSGEDLRATHRLLERLTKALHEACDRE
jgi:DNA-binding MarR family transcriptional regulator